MLRAVDIFKLRLDEGLCSSQEPQDIYLEGSRVEYSCTAGFHLVGPSMLECQAGQTWSSGPGLCMGRNFLPCLNLSLHIGAKHGHTETR